MIFGSLLLFLVSGDVIEEQLQIIQGKVPDSYHQKQQILFDLLAKQQADIKKQGNYIKYDIVNRQFKKMSAQGNWLYHHDLYIQPSSRRAITICMQQSGQLRLFVISSALDHKWIVGAIANSAFEVIYSFQIFGAEYQTFNLPSGVSYIFFYTPQISPIQVVMSYSYITGLNEQKLNDLNQKVQYIKKISTGMAQQQMVSSIVDDGYSKKNKERFWSLLGVQILEYILLGLVCVLSYRSLLSALNTPLQQS